ncbi:MAG: hypothetical protein M1497_00560 [Nitrospirae bacterium]|nr:hypothetical protein [Nitrospirota bacterium]
MEVGEAVSVIASFSQVYRIKPLRFRWSGRLFEVKDITYVWKSKEGRNEIYHFSVSDGNSLYELSFHTESLLWRLEKLEA